MEGRVKDVIDRYCKGKMKALWTDWSKFSYWRRVEIAVCEAWEKIGKVPAGTTAAVKKSRFTVRRIREIEKTTSHDLVAFVNCLAESIGDEGRYIHYGVTSYDIEDTAQALMLQKAAVIILDDLEKVRNVIAGLALKHMSTPMIGRTHGIQAEPITFGAKMAVWHAQIERDVIRVRAAREAVRVGKTSGAVGIFGNVDPEIEDEVCKSLSLEPTIATQIVQRDRHAQFVLALAQVACTLDGLATEMRNLQRTEILEVQEMFLPGQRGSSAMPHKRNPWRFETVCALAKVARGYVIPALENIPSWHERDLTNSASERIILPDICCAVDFMLQSMAVLMGRIEVRNEQMLRNLEMMGQLVFSEHVLLALIQKGMTRDEAYKVCQRNAANCWDNAVSFRTALELDQDCASRLSGAELDECFNLDHHLRNVKAIFMRAGLVEPA